MCVRGGSEKGVSYAGTDRIEDDAVCEVERHGGISASGLNVVLLDRGIWNGHRAYNHRTTGVLQLTRSPVSVFMTVRDVSDRVYYLPFWPLKFRMPLMADRRIASTAAYTGSCSSEPAR